MSITIDIPGPRRHNAWKDDVDRHWH